jgi:hypothetical protein
MTPRAGPPGKRSRAPQEGPDPKGKHIADQGNEAIRPQPGHENAVPPNRPWSGRADAHTVELRFRRDRAGWRRRVDAARRLSFDAADEVAPSRSWNTLEEIGAER